MADITVTAGLVGLLSGNGWRFPGAAGESASAGDVVYIDGTNGLKKADGSAAATAQVVGIIISPKLVVTGDEGIDLAGPGDVIGGFSGMTPGDQLFLSDNAGKLADAAGTKSKPCARAISATEILWTLEEIDPA